MPHFRGGFRTAVSGVRLIGGVTLSYANRRPARGRRSRPGELRLGSMFDWLSDGWYVQSGRTVLGPFSPATFQRMASLGTLEPDR